MLGGQGREDLRLDARVMQLLAAANRLLLAHHQATAGGGGGAEAVRAPAGLEAGRYAVLPLGPQVRCTAVFRGG